MKRMALVIIVLLLGLPSATANSDEDAIRHLLHGTFYRRGSLLIIQPVVVVSDHAIAGWTQGEMGGHVLGGRALLRRKGPRWQVVLCSGDALKSAETLGRVGLAAPLATALAARLAEAEADIDPERLASFARFDGIVLIEPDGHSPPAHGLPYGHHQRHSHPESRKIP